MGAAQNCAAPQISSLPLLFPQKLLFAGAMLTGVSTAGNGGIVLGALGLSSFLMALMSLRFAFLSIREEGRNRIFALGSGVFDLIMILVWTALTVLGLNV